MSEKKATQTTNKVDSQSTFVKKGNDADKNKKRWVKKPQNRKDNKPKDDFEERVVKIKRITKVTKGGRNFRFSATVIVGNHKGLVGFATAKANEVPDAIKKAVSAAKKNTIIIPIVNTTIPHDIIGHFGASKVLIKPARRGTGIISGGPTRTLIELSGIQDIYTKSLGSNTAINMVRATVNGLQQLRTAQEFQRLLGNKEIDQSSSVDTSKVKEQ